MPNEPTITSIKHPAVAEARRRAAGQAGAPGEAFLVDGAKLARQALAAGAAIEAMFFLAEGGEKGSSSSSLLGQAQAAGVACHRLSKGVFFRLLGLGYQTSARVLALVARPACRPRPVGPEQVRSGAAWLVGETIQDPRNVGVLVRTADALGLAGCVFSADSADPWCRAAVRSTTGSIFRVAVSLADDLPRYLAGLRAAGVRVIGSSAAAQHPLWSADLTGPAALLLGNESRGLSPETLAQCDTTVTIPMTGGAHSFNVTVAAGILAYERARQQNARPHTIPPPGD